MQVCHNIVQSITGESMSEELANIDCNFIIHIAQHHHLTTFPAETKV